MIYYKFEEKKNNELTKCWMNSKKMSLDLLIKLSK